MKKSSLVIFLALVLISGCKKPKKLAKSKVVKTKAKPKVKKAKVVKKKTVKKPKVKKAKSTVSFF